MFINGLIFSDMLHIIFLLKTKNTNEFRKIYKILKQEFEDFLVNKVSCLFDSNSFVRCLKKSIAVDKDIEEMWSIQK